MGSNNHSPLQSLTREQFWQQHIKQWQHSGLSKMRYSRDNELAYHQLIYWCEKIRQSEETSSARESGFVSVSLSPTEPKAAATLSVELPNGVRIAGVNAETIGLDRNCKQHAVGGKDGMIW